MTRTSLRKRKPARVGEVDTDTVLIIGLGVAGYFLITHLPDLFNGGSSAEDIATVAKQTALPDTQNPFKPTFEPLIDNYSFLWGGGDMDSFWQNELANAVATSGALDQYLLVGTVQDVVGVADGINNDFGYFVNNDDRLIGIFTGILTSQCEVAAVSSFMLWRYGKDLYDTLINGSWGVGPINNGLFPKNTAKIINAVNAMPVTSDNTFLRLDN